MKPRPRNRRIARTAKYSVPLNEEQSAKAGRLNRRGQIKKGYSVVGGESTSNRIPFTTVAVPKQPKRRRRVAGSINKMGKGQTKIYR